MRDYIYIENLHLFAFHGVNPEEKENGQNFYVSVKCFMDLEPAGVTDDLNQTVSYAKIIKRITKVFTAKKYDLLERAATAVADSILEHYDPIDRVTVKVSKPQAPVAADFGDVGVCITRER